MFKRSIILLINFPSVDTKIEDLKVLQEYIEASLLDAGLTNVQSEDILAKLGNFTISGKMSDGTDRPAMNVGSSPKCQALYIPEGQDYPVETAQDFRHLFIAGTKGAISNAVITLYIN